MSRRMARARRWAIRWRSPDCPAPSSGPTVGPPGGVDGLPPGAAPSGPTPTQVAQRAAADRTFVRVRNLGLLCVAGLMLMSLGIAWLVAGRIVRPLRRVTDTARSIGRERRLDRRIGYEGPHDEIHDLADEFEERGWLSCPAAASEIRTIPKPYCAPFRFDAEGVGNDHRHDPRLDEFALPV